MITGGLTDLSSLDKLPRLQGCTLFVSALFPMLGLDAEGNDFMYHWHRIGNTIYLSAEALQQIKDTVNGQRTPPAGE